MSDDAKSSTSASSSASSSTPTESKASDTSSSSSSSTSSESGGGDKAKSGRAAMGGASVGHYGFFSNVKTEEYKSGWDDIWGKKGKKSSKAKAGKVRKNAPKEPLAAEVDFETLPDEARAALADAVRGDLKARRVSYDNRAKAGKVTWRIVCEVEK